MADYSPYWSIEYACRSTPSTPPLTLYRKRGPQSTDRTVATTLTGCPMFRSLTYFLPPGFTAEPDTQQKEVRLVCIFFPRCVTRCPFVLTFGLCTQTAAWHTWMRQSTACTYRLPLGRLRKPRICIYVAFDLFACQGKSLNCRLNRHCPRLQFITIQISHCYSRTFGTCIYKRQQNFEVISKIYLER